MTDQKNTKYLDYRIITAYEAHTLERKVREYILRGYEPYGFIYMIVTHYAQCMVLINTNYKSQEIK
jgi:hypothetical protein